MASQSKKSRIRCCCAAPGDKSALYKTEPCLRGWKAPRSCPYGKKCRFAHTEEELRKRKFCKHYRKKLCTNFERDGTCDYGNRCRYIHREVENPKLAAPRIPLEKTDSTAAAAFIWTSWVNKAKTPPTPCETRQLNKWILPPASSAHLEKTS